MGTKLPSTLLTKYHKLNTIHSRVLVLSGSVNFKTQERKRFALHKITIKFSFRF